MIPSQHMSRFRDLLFAGRYNLLVGAGISADAKDAHDQPLKPPERLRQDLCALKQLAPNSSLSRASGYLSDEEQETHIGAIYRGCKAGPTASAITRFAWSQLYTLNIDDVLENAYESNEQRLQAITSINYTHRFESFRHRPDIALVHLHGFVRDRTARYVFSHRDYARTTRELNPWMHSLSDLITTEPFIVAGTSLTEPDLEYYLSWRTDGAFIRGADVSLLIEPNPDSGTESDCARLDLVLIKTGLKEFLNWVESTFGASPTPADIVAPSSSPRYHVVPDQYAQVLFYSDFEHVESRQTETPRPGTVSPFYYGRAPSWQDLYERRDVILKSQLELLDRADRWLESPAGCQVIVGLAAAGAGKTTTLKRVALDLANRGKNVFYLRTNDGPDIDAIATIVRCVDGPSILMIDNLAERAGTIQVLLELLGQDFPLLIVGVDRSYRSEHIESVLFHKSITFVDIGRWTSAERHQLIENYRRAGLIGLQEALRRPRDFARQIAHNTIAEAVCRILNDFRPLRSIVTSLWSDADPPLRDAYICAALAYFCLPQGIRAPVLGAATRGIRVHSLDRDDCSLPIVRSPGDDEFMIPLNTVVAEQLVGLMSHERPERLLDAFVRLANVLAPYVTRQTIRQQTAEAKLAGRLFDSDKIVGPLLGKLAEDFYDRCYEQWQWNSRYWEQRALSVASTDLETAIHHARHALSIDRHPFALTTLSKLLLKQIEDRPSSLTNPSFNEAFDLLQSAIRSESTFDRPRSKHAFWVFLRGIRNHLTQGRTLTERQWEFAREVFSDVDVIFGSRSDLGRLVREIRQLPEVDT